MSVDLARLAIIANPHLGVSHDADGYVWYLRRQEDSASVDAARQFDTGKIPGMLAFADGLGPEPLWCTIVWYDADQEPVAIYDTYHCGLVAIREDRLDKMAHIAVASDMILTALS